MQRPSVFLDSCKLNDAKYKSYLMRGGCAGGSGSCFGMCWSALFSLKRKARSTDAQREVRKVICVTKKENKIFVLKNCQTNQKVEVVSDRLTGFCDLGKL